MLIEFIYPVQDLVHTDSSITAMEQTLTEFHATKQSILDLEVQRGSKGPIGHFKIPKLKLMMSFIQQTKVNDPLIPYTANVLEHLLIMHCKTMFQHTSHNTHTYVDQVIKILNCEKTTSAKQHFSCPKFWQVTQAIQLLHSNPVCKRLIFGTKKVW